MASVKFFGQYLLLEGAVTMDQLREALQLMEREHKVLGQLAVEQKLLTLELAPERIDAPRLGGKIEKIRLVF